MGHVFWEKALHEVRAHVENPKMGKFCDLLGDWAGEPVALEVEGLKGREVPNVRASGPREPKPGEVKAHHTWARFVAAEDTCPVAW